MSPYPRYRREIHETAVRLAVIADLFTTGGAPRPPFAGTSSIDAALGSCQSDRLGGLSGGLALG
jgi:hypothetical protein